MILFKPPPNKDCKDSHQFSCKNRVIGRLKSKGMELSMIQGFIRSFSNILHVNPNINANVAKVEGAADPRRQGCSCSNLPQALDNAGDAVPSAFP
jgi:hypothetical protein